MINSLILSEKCNKTHKSVIVLIEKYKDMLNNPKMDIKDNDKGKQTEYYFLTEYQTKLLIMLMQNSDVVIRFKVEILNNSFNYTEFTNYQLKGYITHVIILKNYDKTYSTSISKGPKKHGNTVYISPGFTNGNSVECSVRHNLKLGDRFKADKAKLNEIITFIEGKGKI